MGLRDLAGPRGLVDLSEMTVNQGLMVVLDCLAQKENKVLQAMQDEKAMLVPLVQWETKETLDSRVPKEELVTVEVQESRESLVLAARPAPMANRALKEILVPLELKAARDSKDLKATTETKVDKEPPVPTVLQETRVRRA